MSAINGFGVRLGGHTFFPLGDQKFAGLNLGPQDQYNAFGFGVSADFYYVFSEKLRALIGAQYQQLNYSASSTNSRSASDSNTPSASDIGARASLVYEFDPLFSMGVTAGVNFSNLSGPADLGPLSDAVNVTGEGISYDIALNLATRPANNFEISGTLGWRINDQNLERLRVAGAEDANTRVENPYKGAFVGLGIAYFLGF